MVNAHTVMVLKGFTKKNLNTETFAYGFDGTRYGVETHFVRGGIIKRCIDCDKPVDASEITPRD